MKLEPGEIVQWKRDGGWKRGRIMRTPLRRTVIQWEDGKSYRESEVPVLVKHSITGELEFVPWGNLEIQGEVHSDE